MLSWTIPFFLFGIIDGQLGGTGGTGVGSYALDVFGQAVSTSTGVPALKKQCECVCPNCQRNLAASRFAPHLEKVRHYIHCTIAGAMQLVRGMVKVLSLYLFFQCMGMGRNSSRIASRRLATSTKESGGYREDDEGNWFRNYAMIARIDITHFI